MNDLLALDVYKRQIKEMAKNVAMQAAALKPLYTNDSEVDADYIAKEKEILTVAAKNEKPDANDKIINGMVTVSYTHLLHIIRTVGTQRDTGTWE